MRRLFLAGVAVAAVCLGAAPQPAIAVSTPLEAIVSTPLEAIVSTPLEAIVSIDNFSFSPPEITVAAGTTVTWTNRDDIPHTVTGVDEKLFRSPPLDTDDHFAYRFDHPGRFTYFCSLHAHMQGAVVVR